MQPEQNTPQIGQVIQPSTQTNPQQQNNVSQTVMPTKNPASIVSYYCGVFGLVPIIGFPLSINAVISGHKAMKLWRIQPTPGAKGHAMTGLILGYIELAVFAAFAIFVAYVISQAPSI